MPFLITFVLTHVRKMCPSVQHGAESVIPDSYTAMGDQTACEHTLHNM